MRAPNERKPIKRFDVRQIDLNSKAGPIAQIAAGIDKEAIALEIARVLAMGRDAELVVNPVAFTDRPLVEVPHVEE